VGEPTSRQPGPHQGGRRPGAARASCSRTRIRRPPRQAHAGPGSSWRRRPAGTWRAEHLVSALGAIAVPQP